MFNSLNKIGVLALFKLKSSVFLSLLAIFLIGCGGGGNSSQNDSNPKECNSTASNCHTVSFYDEDLSLIETQLVKEGQIDPSKLLSGVWYRANENLQITSYTLTDNVSFYEAPNVIEITDQAELNAMRNKLDGRYVLLNDIALDGSKKGFSSSEGWEPIGNAANPFTGILNAKHHVISGLWVKKPNADDIGLFGYTVNAKIKNLGVKTAEGKEVAGLSNIGVIVGHSYSSSIINSYSEGNLSGTGPSIAGIVGYSINNNISNGYFKGNSNAGYTSGGIAGSADGTTIINSYSLGSVKSNTTNAGGIVGWAKSGVMIKNSYSMASISGKQRTGGILGYAIANSSVTLKNNAAVNPSITVVDSPNTNIHRIVGTIEATSYILSNNFALESMSVNGRTVSEGNEKDGKNKADIKFKQQSTYENELGWGFGDDDENPWKMDENGGYPYLYWEKR
ncbi:MAG: hypothetical protein LBF71_04845 [Campylobacteraceae bacterium]|jgi:hypothetical protein|nr:hypothetical protein [Campylobacteraceae bacterium]